MRKNRRNTKHLNVHSQRTCCVAGIIGSLFLMLMLNILVKGSTEQVAREIQLKREQIARLDEEYERQNAIWEGMKTDAQLRLAMRQQGMHMATPRDTQIVRMNAVTRRANLGQHSVVMARQALARNVAEYTPAPRSRGTRR